MVCWASWTGFRSAVGTARFLHSQGVDAATVASTTDEPRHPDATAVLVAVDGRHAGVIGIADRVKDTTPEAFTALLQEGIEVIMLTGDNRSPRRRWPRTWVSLRSRPCRSQERGRPPAPCRRRRNRLRRRRSQIRTGADGRRRRAGHEVGHRRRHRVRWSHPAMGDLNRIAHARRFSRATMSNLRGNLWIAFGHNADPGRGGTRTLRVSAGPSGSVSPRK